MDYFITIGIVLGLFMLGAVCVLWPKAMLWPDRGILTAGLNEQTRKFITQIGGLVVLIFSLLFAWKLLRN